MQIVCIGGGASSFFFVANVLAQYPNAQITILEQGKEVLQKVRISGGGRCNVTHACFTPQELTQSYPRGYKELLGSFYQFQPQDTMAWFEARGVALQTEEDGRVFPVSNQSESIICCLQQHTDKATVCTQSKVVDIFAPQSPQTAYTLQLKDGQELNADILFIGAGSSRSLWKILDRLGHTILPIAPSLFTFKVDDVDFNSLSGVTVPMVTIKTKGLRYESNGALLFTHKGVSGPAVLKMSAFGALHFQQQQYTSILQINWRPDLNPQEVLDWKTNHADQWIDSPKVWQLPKRVVQVLLAKAGLEAQIKFQQIGAKQLQHLAKIVTAFELKTNGQNTFKAEFVTAGGVDLKEVNFKTFASKKLYDVYFSGEILNIDGVTGGFNFQAAWTGAHIAAMAVVRRLER